MGGMLEVTITVEPERRAEADSAAQRAARRVQSWASRLTRFNVDFGSLGAQRRSGRSSVRCGQHSPRLCAGHRSPSDARTGSSTRRCSTQRLAAETGWRRRHERAGARLARWQIAGSRSEPRRSTRAPISASISTASPRAGSPIVPRTCSTAGRAWPSTPTATSVPGGTRRRVARGRRRPAQPRRGRTSSRHSPAAGRRRWSRAYGVATSGTSVHRWQLPTGARPTT